jgi:hypothetical protein
MDKRQKKTKTNTVFNNKTRFPTNKNHENKLWHDFTSFLR